MSVSSPLVEIDSIRYSWPTQSSWLASLMPSRRVTAEWQLGIREFCLDSAEMIFVHGASGSGKSTFLNLLAGILRPDDGQIRVDGRDLKQMAAGELDQLRADLMGVIFQQFNLLPYLSVMDNVLLGTYFKSSSHASYQQSREEAKELLNAFEIPQAYWYRAVTQMSVGQQQRVAAARAFLGQPRLVLADEPTSSLDTAMRDGFMEILMNLGQDYGAAVILVSHDLVLSSYFSRVLAFEDLIELNQS